MQYLYLVISLFMIFVAAELFTNAVEWFGKRLKICEGAVGSVLAAVGTALPETSVAIVAIAKGGAHSSDVGIGAILGAPMMLSTLAMFITGMAVIVFASRKLRPSTIQADYRVVGHDLRSFFLVYAMALIAAVIPVRGIQIAVATVLVFTYFRYVYKTFKSASCISEEEEMRRLHFHRAAEIPKFRWVLIQLAAGLFIMLIAADWFVENVKYVADALGVPALVLSLIIVPIATELPEKFNSITWMRHKKDTLALGNITGAMVFQSSILPAIGIIFTSWHLNTQAIASIVVALLATFIIWAEMNIKKRMSPYALLVGGGLYLLYPIFVFAVMPAIK